MGGNPLEYWRFELWEYQGSSPVSEYLAELVKSDARHYRAVRHRIRSLREMPMERVEKTGLLRPIHSDLHELEVAAGGASYLFLGPLRQASWSTTFIALEAYRAGATDLRTQAVVVAADRLKIYQENESLHYNPYGLQ